MTIDPAGGDDEEELKLSCHAGRNTQKFVRLTPSDERG
jgi:hypothetical protein